MKFLVPILTVAVALAAFPDDADAGRRKKKRHRGCGSVPAALRGGETAQRSHNAAADADDLTRLEDRDDLVRFVDKGLLVPVDDTSSYYLDGVGGHDPKRAELYRHARPWTKKYLDRKTKLSHAKFGVRFKVTSLVRTDAYQGKICRSGNGAAICGGDWWEQSLHTTGAALDISKHRMSCKVQKWWRSELIADIKRGLIGAIEERGAFHVFVRKAYGAEPKKKAAKKKAKKKTKKAKRGKGGKRSRARTR